MRPNLSGSKPWATPLEPNATRIHFLVAVIGAAAFTVESWLLGPYSWIYGYGSGLETIPVYLALSADSRNFSFFAPFVGGGLDRLAFWGNADPVSIEQLLFTILPTWLANGLHRYLQYFVAIFFAARVAEEEFSLDPRWSSITGILHGCFVYLTAGALLTISGVPLLIWLLRRVTRNGSFFLAIVVGLVFSLCTTFTFSVPYLLAFAAGWMLLVKPNYSLHAIGLFTVFSLSWVIAESPQLLAVMANAPMSHRVGWPSESLDWSIDGLFYRQLQFDLFAQDRYLSAITLNVPGIVFLAGLPLAVHIFRKRSELSPISVHFLRLFALYALLSQKWMWVLLQSAAGKIFPWVAGIYMGRFYQIPGAFMIAMGTALICCMVWRELLFHAAARGGAVVVASVFVAFMVVWPKIHLFYPLGVDDWGEKNYQVTALEELKARESEPFRVASVLPLQPAYAYAQGLETADGWANLFPAVYRDLWLRTMDPLYEKVPITKSIFAPYGGKPQDNYIFLGADLIHPDVGLLPGEDPFQALIEGFDLDARFNLNIPRLLNVRYLLSEYPLKSAAIKLVHAPRNPPVWPQSRSHATGLVHGLRPPAKLEPGLFGSLSRPWTDYAAAAARKSAGKDIFIYEVTGALPRFRFVRSIVVRPDGKSVLDAIAAADHPALASSAFLESGDSAALDGNRATFSDGTITVTGYSPDEITLRIVNDGPGLLVIANTWNSFWRAEVDGKERKLVRVNHAQMALPTAAADRLVRLRYLPPYHPASLVGRTAKPSAGALQ